MGEGGEDANQGRERERERQTEMEKRRVFEVALCLAGRSEGRRLLAGGTKVKSRRKKEIEKKRCAESEGGIKKGGLQLKQGQGRGRQLGVG